MGLGINVTIGVDVGIGKSAGVTMHVGESVHLCKYTYVFMKIDIPYLTRCNSSKRLCKADDHIILCW